MFEVKVTIDGRTTFSDRYVAYEQAWEVHDTIRRQLRRTFAEAIVRDVPAGTGAHLTIQGSTLHDYWVEVR